MKKLVSELKERRFIPLLTGYLAGGWVVLEVVDQLTGNDVIPSVVYPLALTLLVCGIPAVAIVAWYHGAKGGQKASAREVVMLACVAVAALGATALVARTQLAEPQRDDQTALDRLPPTEDPRRIAVLYFDALGSNEEAELLATGITESLIDELARVPAVHVVSRNGVAPLRGRTSFPADSVRKALQVGTFVRGSVAEVDSTVRVRVEVVRARDERSVGSSTFERPRSEFFALQDDIAAQVSLFLRETIGAEIDLAASVRPTENVDAWVLVQQAADEAESASRLVGLNDPEGAWSLMERADSLLAEAERRAADWSVPATRRGWLAYDRARWLAYDRTAIPDLLAEGLDHAGRALSRDPRDANALELRATIKYWSYLLNLTSTPGEAARLLEEAEADFNASTTANPAQASAFASYSHLLMNRGATAQAKLAAQRSYETDPWLRNANVILWRLFQASLDLEDEQEARTWCEVGAERFSGDYHFDECVVWLYALPTNKPEEVARDVDEIWSRCEAVVRKSPPSLTAFNQSRCHMVAAMGLYRASLPDSARAVARRSRAGVDVDPIRELAWLEGIVLAWLGDNDAAVERLALYLAANPGQVASFARDDTWWLEDLRGDPGYQRLLSR